MAITTAQYKAAIEAKIGAYDSSTPLTTLAVTKSNADLWLANNSGGSITGYSTLEALIQTKQNALTVSSPLPDVSLVGTSAFPPLTGGGLPVIPASALAVKTTDGDLVISVSLSAENCTGAGKTYSVVGKGLLTFVQLSALTNNDTYYSLTIDGEVKGRALTTPLVGTSRKLIDVGSSDYTGTGEGGNPSAAIEFSTGFSLFVRTVADNSITVSYSTVGLK